MSYNSKTYSIIRLSRQKKALSQENMTQVLSITQPAYSHIERNVSSLTLERLQKIAEYLEVSISELLSESSTNNADFLYNRSITIYQYPKGLVERIEKIEETLAKLKISLRY